MNSMVFFLQTKAPWDRSSSGPSTLEVSEGLFLEGVGSAKDYP